MKNIPLSTIMLTHLLRVLLILSCLASCAPVIAQISNNMEFEYIPTGGASVNSIFCDSNNRTLATSSNGLLVFNGKIFKNITPNINGVICDENIYTALKTYDNNLLLCTANGLYNLDLTSNTFSFIYETASLDIRTITKIDSTYALLGTATGLATFNIKTKQTRRINDAPTTRFNALAAHKDKIYAGADTGLLVYDATSKSCSNIDLECNGLRYNNVIALSFDYIRNCLWIGTDKGILMFSPDSGILSPISIFNNISVYAIMVDSVGDLWIGTNSGLYIYNTTNGIYNHYTHNSNAPMSIADNEIKSIFEDTLGNIWIGTISGVSLFYKHSNFTIKRWSQFSNSAEGGRITAIYITNDNTIFIGSSNGLIIHTENNNDLNRQETRLAGHSINDIYADFNNNIWVASNKGLHLYDNIHDKFIDVSVNDPTGKYRSDHCTNIFEDSKHNLWISTYSNGIFEIESSRIPKFSATQSLVANRHFFKMPRSSELISKKINSATIDHNNDLWVAAGTDGLTKIQYDTERLDYFSFTQSEKHLNVKDIANIYCDNKGDIWIVGRNAIDKINPVSGAISHITSNDIDNKMFIDIVDIDNNLWVLYSEGFVVIDMDTFHTTTINLPESNYSCMYHDKKSGMLWVGGRDLMIQFSPEAQLTPSSSQGSILPASLYVNNQEILPDIAYDGNIILTETLPFTREITLNPYQNNLDIEFYGQTTDINNAARYCYRTTNSDDWKEIDGPNFHISFNNLSDGSFTLQILQLEKDGRKSAGNPYELKINVLPHWYLSTWAKIIYTLILLGLIAWIVKYQYMKNRLRFEQLEKEKVKELSNMKINFLTDVAHELKTPLSLILEPVNKLINVTKSQEQKATLQIVYSNALRLGRLVHQVLNLKSMDISDIQEHTYPLEIVEFANSIVTTFFDYSHIHNIELSFHSSVEHLIIMTDAIKLESIIRNLISNALKFTPAGGNVDIKLDLLDNPDGKFIKLVVADSGVGIPVNDIPRIFDRFFQSDHNVSINKNGSGIGLSMVKYYISQFNGKIEVESQLNQGSTFTITLPMVEPNDNAPHAETDNSEFDDNEGVKVLLVEDNVEIARFISENLKNFDCRIAHNGKSGFELAKSYHPDIVITDVMMPVMDGIEMSKLIRNNPSTASIPIIVLTAKDDRTTEYDAYSIGIDAFISKPFEIRHLLVRIKQLLNSRLSSKANTEALVNDSRAESLIASLASADERFKVDITNIIEENIDDPQLNVQRLSELSGISSKQIYRKIKSTTGSTVVDYIKSIRMKKAAQLLSRKQFTVSEVMYMVGFNSSSYFSKCFMQKYGKNPKEYMDDCQSEP